jgi:diaminopimelate epimerase
MKVDVSPASLGFEKYEGLGNDFIVVDAASPDALSVERARRLCDRRRGVGGDGVLLVLPADDPAHAGRMVVINADGSIPEMCGNGIRCVAIHVARRKKLVTGELTFETGAGPRRCVVDDTDRQGTVSVDMGAVRFVEDIRLDLDGDSWDLSLADAGNPHAITRRPMTRTGIERVGPLIATHRRFAAGTNVEFALVHSPTEIELVVWERGVGITDACGTGACATVAVAVEKGWAAPSTEVTVRLPGGPLKVNVALPGEQVIMTGPARHVYGGQVDAGALDSLHQRPFGPSVGLRPDLNPAADLAGGPGKPAR